MSLVAVSALARVEAEAGPPRLLTLGLEADVPGVVDVIAAVEDLRPPLYRLEQVVEVRH